jgi:hypothetical protein
MGRVTARFWGGTHTRLRRRWLASAAVVAVVAGFALVPVGPAAAAPRVSCPQGVADLVSALARARACGGRVEVLGRRSEREQVFANADGSLRLESSVVPRRVRRADGSWTPVDTSLRVEPDGSLVPTAVAQPVRLSGGGTRPLVSVQAGGGGGWSLSWPSPLPAPRVSAGSALYPDVRPGVDLRVTALATGFSYTLVVRTRQALADPALRRIPVTVAGPSLRPRGDGGAEAVAIDGGVVLVVGGASMWDSRGPAGLTGGDLPARERATAEAAGVLSSADGPGDSARRARVGVRVSGRELVLEPDPTLLADPDVTLPLYVDPQITAPRGRWAYANSANASYDNTGGVARVGRNPDCCGETWRGFFEFGLGPVAGTHILAASVNSTVVHSWNCTPQPVSLYRTSAIPGGVGDGGRTGWSPSLDEWLNEQSAHGCNGGQPVSFPITGNVQAWVNAGWSWVTLGLSNRSQSGANETNVQYWKKFSVAATVLVVNYNTVPGAPEELATIGTSQRVGCDTAGRVNASGGAGLSATLRDNDSGNALVARFEWQDVTAGTAVTALPDTAGFTSPHTFEAALPAPALSDGHRVRWRVRGFDGTDNGPFSPWCEFVVDNSTPGQPTITAPGLAVYPGTPPATTVIGTPTIATLSPATGDTDIVGYYYGVGAVETAPTMWAPAAFDGTANVAVVPLVSGLGKNVLTVVAVDEAGNRSPIPVSAPDAPGTRQFRANGATATPRVSADATGDGRADVTVLGDIGGGNRVVWRWDTTDTGAGVTNPVAPQGITTVYPLSARTVGGDFDGDGRADIAVFDQAAGGVSLTVQRSAGNGMFGAPTQFLSGWNLASMKPVVGNFDADPAGRDDIAVFYDEGNVVFTIRVLLANGAPAAPTFASPVTWYTNPQGYSYWSNMKTFAGDFDGDGRVDVADFYDHGNCQTKLWVHYSTGSAFNGGVMLWDSGAGSVCWDRTYPVTGDFDGDGRADIASFYRNDGCQTALQVFYGNANRTVAVPTPAWNSAPNAWCADRAAVSAGDFNADGKADLAAVYRCCAGFQAALFTFTSTGRAFMAPARRWEGGIGPAGTGSDADLLVGASGTASSSAPDSWGWSVRAATDGLHGGKGWSSWSNTDVDHTEWLELRMPAPRDINRVDLYPRGDAPYAGDNFPANFTVEAWNGSAWIVVASRTGYPKPSTGAAQTFTFPAVTTDRIRIVGTSLKLMQFAEVGAYRT